MLSLFVAQLSDWNNWYLNIDTKDISCTTAILNNIIIINYTMMVGLILSENNSTQRQTWWYNVVLNRVRVMVFNATFSNISAISWWLVLLVQVTDKPSQIILYLVHLAWVGFELTTSVVISTDCTGSCLFNYHTITTTTAPVLNSFWNELQSSYKFRISVAFTRPSTILCVFFRNFFVLLIRPT